MNLTVLSPQIQEELVFAENDKLAERTIREVLKEPC
jgi:hypothetical protein